MEQHQTQNDDDSEPWEALDVDDSDLPFLRPCKRRQSHPPKPLVPGPAAAVQAAMLRRERSGEGGDDSVPTQEYIRSALDGGGACADDDFASDPWLVALNFLRTHGVLEGDSEVLRTPLSSIKNGIHGDRVNLVVAVVKSCTRTGLGDLMVTLKDPTGTICASVHRKALSEGEHGKNISVGSVLILKKVAVFAPSRSAYYLNITLSNVIKVMSKDSGRPLRQNYLPSVRCATQDSETRKTSNTPIGNNRSQEIIQGIIDNLRKNSEIRESMYSNREMDKNSVPETSCFSDENYKNPVETEKESPFTNRVKSSEFVNVAFTEHYTSKDRAILVDEQPEIFKLGDGDNSTYGGQATNAAATVVEVTSDQEIRSAFGNENAKQPLVSSTAVPDWTEEQLDQLGVLFHD